MHLGQGGKCKACKGGGQTINLKPQQPLIDMIFTYVVDPRCAGRLDDKQGGDTLVMIKRVRKEIAFKSVMRSCGRVNMIVAHIGANGLFLEPNRWARARGEGKRFR